MTATEPCHICGDCWWFECPNPADYSVDVGLKRHGRPLFSGEIDLCAGHYRFAAENGGHLNLKPLAIEQALAAQRVKVPR